MNYLQGALAPGESIIRSEEFKGPALFEAPHDEPIDFSVHTIQKDGVREGDEVLVEVNASSEPCVLIGGNEIEITPAIGMGKLCTMDLATGVRNVEFLSSAGRKTIVSPTNTLYWYENVSRNEWETFIIHDRCEDFDPQNEPSLEGVVGMLQNVLRIALTNYKTQ